MTQTKSGYIESSASAQAGHQASNESRLSEDADPLTRQLDFIA